MSHYLMADDPSKFYNKSFLKDSKNAKPVFMKNILLVSVLTWDSMAEIPFMLKRGGCSCVDVLCPKNAWLNANSYFDNWIEIKSDQADIQQQIIDIAQDPQSPYTKIMLIDDVVIKFISECELPGDLFSLILPLTKRENRELLASKVGFSNVCIKYNIVTPQYKIYQEELPLEEQITGLRFPLILKEDLSWGGGGIYLCDDWAAFENAILHQVNTKKNLVIQEYIIGDDIGVEALFCKGQLITYNCSQVLSYFDNKFTFTTRRKYYRNHKIEELLGIMGNAFGVTGFASISYIYHPKSDTYYLIEMDTRTNMWMPLSRFTGFDFAEGLKRIVAHWPAPIPESPTLPAKTVEIALFYRDLRRCFKKRDFKGFARWIFNYQGYWRFIPLYDQRLFWHMITVVLGDFKKLLSPNKKSFLMRLMGKSTKQTKAA